MMWDSGCVRDREKECKGVSKEYLLGINMVRDLIVHGIKLWCTSITNFALACWKATVHLFVISYGAKFKKMD